MAASSPWLACVIGGGTSAAEAVIAISNAKIADGDPTPIYWSYRGDKLPRVSKALAEVFFEAYVGNGNIRYHPKSDPAAVVIAEDRKEYLSPRWTRAMGKRGTVGTWALDRDGAGVDAGCPGRHCRASRCALEMLAVVIRFSTMSRFRAAVFFYKAR